VWGPTIRCRASRTRRKFEAVPPGLDPSCVERKLGWASCFGSFSVNSLVGLSVPAAPWTDTSFSTIPPVLPEETMTA